MISWCSNNSWLFINADPFQVNPYGSMVLIRRTHRNLAGFEFEASQVVDIDNLNASGWDDVRQYLRIVR